MTRRVPRSLQRACAAGLAPTPLTAFGLSYKAVAAASLHTSRAADTTLRRRVLCGQGARTAAAPLVANRGVGSSSGGNLDAQTQGERSEEGDAQEMGSLWHLTRLALQVWLLRQQLCLSTLSCDLVRPLACGAGPELYLRLWHAAGRCAQPSAPRALACVSCIAVRHICKPGLHAGNSRFSSFV